ncbi:MULTISPECIES: hypothetical protein [unclassified Plantibacter]|jgi:hypothetical protein|uniref:hypothetical protein n=1 Tax=unclassified Plantibacter TaxID=2624265 RepID=UPI003D337B0C
MTTTGDDGRIHHDEDGTTGAQRSSEVLDEYGDDPMPTTGPDADASRDSTKQDDPSDPASVDPDTPISTDSPD